MPKDSQPDSKEQEAKKKSCCHKKTDPVPEDEPDFSVSGTAPEKKRCNCHEKTDPMFEEKPDFSVSGTAPEKKRCCKKKS